MESALSIWERRRDEDWVAGVEQSVFRGMVEARRTELASVENSGCVSINTKDPLQFSAEFLAAITHAKPLHIFLGEMPENATHGEDTRIMVATGGTTGEPRYAVHNWESLAAAAIGLQAWMGGGPISSVCFLPLRHMSGLMQFVRAFATDGEIVFEAAPASVGQIVPEGAVTSLVPTQLARLLEDPRAVEWLARFRFVFVGGGPVWPDLLGRSRASGLSIALCYGMTETAAQIAAQSPRQFLAGAEPSAEVLPHACVEIVDENGRSVQCETPGRIRIKSTSLFSGYWPEVDRAEEWFLSDDRGKIDTEGRLRILGRADAVVITGGEKVEPGEVEEAILATGLANDVAVVGVPDEEWGEVVAAVVECGGDSIEEIARRLRSVLDGFKIPKRWKRVDSLPRDEIGKVDRQALRKIASNQ